MKSIHLIQISHLCFRCTFIIVKCTDSALNFLYHSRQCHNTVMFNCRVVSIILVSLFGSMEFKNELKLYNNTSLFGKDQKIKATHFFQIYIINTSIFDKDRKMKVIHLIQIIPFMFSLYLHYR